MDDEKQKRTASPQAGPDEQLTPRFLLPGFSLDELEDLRIDARGKIAFLQEFGGALKHARHVGFMVETLAQRADLAEAERLWRTSQEAAEGTRPAWYPRHLNPLLAAEIVRRLPLPAFLADHAEYGEGMFQPVLSGLRSPCPLVEHDPKNARFFHRPDAGTWACLDCRLAGDTFGLAHRLLGLGGDALLDALLQEAGLPPPGGAMRRDARSGGMPMAIRQDANAAGWAATWLLPHHRQELIVGSGLTDATLAAARVFSVTSPWVASMLGFGHLCQRLPAIAFPLLLPDRVGAPDRDVVVLKPDLPRRDDRLRLVKYEFRRGTANRLYVPDAALAVLADASVCLAITEGHQKKALKASQEGIPTVALAGVWNFRTRLHGRASGGKSRPLSDLDLVTWLGRQVELAYDADLATNPSVAAAAYALARELTRRGAHVRRVVLPLGPAGKIDDFLVRHGAAAYAALPRGDVTPPPPLGTSRRPVRVV